MEYNDYFEAECKRTNTVFDDWSNCYFYSEIYYYYDEEVCDRALEAVQKWYKDRDMDVLEKVTHPMNSEYPFAIAVELRESELRIVKDPDFQRLIMSKLSKAKSDLVFLKKYSEYMKENEWKYADYEIKAFERLIKYCDV